MSKPLKYGLIGAGVVLLLLIVIPFLIPAGAYRARIEQAALEQTGRKLKIDGALHVTLFPALGVRADNVTLANVVGGHAATFASMGELRVAVRLWPLIGGRVEVSEIVLDRPVINLERDSAGQGNWTFRSSQPGHFSTRFSGIRITNGAVTYRSADGRTRAVEHADLTIGLTAVDQPVMLDGEVVYRQRRVSLEARIANLTPLKAGQSRDADISLTSDLLQASFKGQVAAEGGFEGALKLDTTNVSGLSDWLGENLPRDIGFKTVSLEARVEAHGGTFALPEESLRLDGMTVTGHMGVDLNGKRPSITGDVVLDRLDLNRYIDRGASRPETPAKPESGWSAQPVDLSLLHLFDANLSIDAGALRLRGLHLSKSHLAASLVDGLLDVTLDPMTLYGGTGKAHLVVDVRASVPQFRNELAFENVSMRALLNDSINVQRLAGRGTLAFSVTSEGDSASAIMHNIAGSGSLGIVNGEINGVDLGAVARLVRTALTLEATGEQATTPFIAMGGSFAIAHGVLATKDFHLDSKLLRATGTGTVDLGNRSLDFLVKPRAVLLPVGIGLGVVFPFHAQGPWHSVTYTADVTGAVTGLVSDVFNVAMAVPGAITGFFPGTDKQKPNNKKKKQTGFLGGLFGH